MNLQSYPSIFISSTTLDFFQYRRKTKEALQSRGFPTIVMEDFPPSPDGVSGISLQKVRESDIYVVLLGYRYGTPFPNPGDPSVTELEFLEARQTGKLIFAYIPNEQDPPVFEYEDKAADGTRRMVRMTRDNMHPRQQQFIYTVTKDMMSYVAATYSNPIDLPQKVMGDILQKWQGSAPGEMAYRRGLSALSVIEMEFGTQSTPYGGHAPNYEAGYSELSRADFLLSSEAPRYKVSFLQALAMLHGYVPRNLRDEDVAPIEDLLRASIVRSNGGQGFWAGYALWAAIKHNHYVLNGINHPHLDLAEAMYQRARLLVNPKEDSFHMEAIKILNPPLYDKYIKWYPFITPGGMSLRNIS
jgi:hypothetical protein